MKNVSYYLSKGFDERTAKYFASGRRTLMRAIPRQDFSVLLQFDNGETRIFDMKPLIEPGTVFAFLSSYDAFLRVYVDDTHSLCWDKDPSVNSNEVWNNKVDVSADTCYLDSVPEKEAAYG